VASFFLLRWGCCEIMVVNHDSSNLILPNSLGCQVHATAPRDRIFGTFCLGWPQTLNLWISVSQVVTDMNHWGYPVLKELV
jgi:hypothetical protein